MKQNFEHFVSILMFFNAKKNVLNDITNKNVWVRCCITTLNKLSSFFFQSSSQMCVFQMDWPDNLGIQHVLPLLVSFYQSAANNKCLFRLSDCSNPSLYFPFTIFTVFKPSLFKHLLRKQRGFCKKSKGKPVKHSGGTAESYSATAIVI